MIGQIIDNLIKESGSSKSAFAKYLGISRTTLDDYINGKTFMSSNLIEKTAAYFKVSIAYLFGEVSEAGKYVDEQLRQQLYELTQQVKKLNKIMK